MITRTTDDSNRAVRWRLDPGVRFLMFNIIFGVVCFAQLRDLLVTSWRSEYYSYIPFIPAISAYLMYGKRLEIFREHRTSPAPGVLFLVVGLLLAAAALMVKPDLDQYDYLAIMTLGMLVFWVGGLATCYGVQAVTAALFPLLFLLFAVPLPNAVREGIILFLQSGSTEATDLLLKISGLMYVREGFVFYLDWTTIEVAKECSGIRSSLSLIVTGALAGQMFLHSSWAKTVLLASIVPIAIIKNGIRIATLTLLGTYWDPRILDSDLHRRGGFVFFIMALLLCGVVIAVLRKIEKGKDIYREDARDARTPTSIGRR